MKLFSHFILCTRLLSIYNSYIPFFFIFKFLLSCVFVNLYACSLYRLIFYIILKCFYQNNLASMCFYLAIIMQTILSMNKLYMCLCKSIRWWSIAENLSSVWLHFSLIAYIHNFVYLHKFISYKLSELHFYIFVPFLL